ncbi:hypothetical protein [Vagococcus fluvialis]|uniref:hypothetical protein n=1 Tax=Vagococcus fluvialis TaxID=2738 RepID=UPI0020335BE2|nr:hypothetical protein [Vagococcus fluvialis]MCM2138917.1 hypothetical protein [Vagococcus fluvialis]
MGNNICFVVKDTKGMYWKNNIGNYFLSPRVLFTTEKAAQKYADCRKDKVVKVQLVECD